MRFLLSLTSIVLLALACSSANNNQGGQDGGNNMMGPPDSGQPGPPNGFPVCTQDNWANWAQSFMQTNCVRCHPGPGGNTSYTAYSTIETESVLIRRDVVGHTM